MSVAFLMDVHVRWAVTAGLRLRGVDVVTAQEDGCAILDDGQLLDRAKALGRVLYSQDEDLLREAVHRQRNGIPFFGVVYAHQLRITDSTAINDLELIAKVYDPADMDNRIEYLPL